RPTRRSSDLAVMRIEEVQRRAADRLGQRQDRIGIEIHKMGRKFIDGGELLLTIIEEMNEAFDLVAMDAKDARNAVNRRSRPHFRFILRAHRPEAKALAGLPDDRRGKPKGVLQMTEGIRRLCHIELHVHMVHLVAFPLVDAAAIGRDQFAAHTASSSSTLIASIWRRIASVSGMALRLTRSR